jgi:N6-adenosine-specific RNA methylase IME4
MAESSLIIFTKAEQMLAEADTIQKAKELKDLALTAADWAKRKNMGEQAIQHCRSYALRAEVKLGEMLLAGEESGEVATTGHPPTGEKKKRVSTGNALPATAADLGLSRKQKAEAKALASLPKMEQEAVADGTKTKAQARREAKASEVRRSTPLPSGKFRVIYADPPWSYGDQLTENYGATRFHYPSMSTTQLCALPVGSLAEDNAVLFLWVTAPILPEAFAIVKAWGFAYKTNFVWNKLAHNMGHYSSVRHEHLLLCTRGSCLPDIKELVPSVVEVKRGKHSEKPEEFRAIIDLLYPRGKRIELFARAELPKNWTGWGNEYRA